MADENSPKKGFLGFFQTIPGLLTGLAALIVAITGLVGLFWPKEPSTVQAAKGPEQPAIWQKNLDAMGPTNRGLHMGQANQCGYNSWAHRETYVAALNALTLNSDPTLASLRDRLLSEAQSMPPQCGYDNHYDLALSPNMKDLQAELMAGLRDKVIENGGHLSDQPR